MRVWRVAHETATDRNGFPSGPYASGGLPHDVAQALDGMRWDHCDAAHPSPRGDVSLYDIREEEHCGFDSLAALYEWFEERWRVTLFANGFRVFVYDVPNEYARVGRHGQTLFDRHYATPVTTLELTDFYGEQAA